jgi:large subunit ribosomal protein L4
MPKTVKPSVKKVTKKSAKKVVVEPVKKEKKMTVPASSYPIVSPKGDVVDSIELPKELFGLPYNAQLVSQAIRVYRTNQREGSAATKTRGMVEGSTRKIYKQKGTGRARHGGIRAPIFVGGGITFGPQTRDIHGILPQKMRKHALGSALSHMVEDKKMIVVDGLKELPIKTKAFAQMLKDVGTSKRTLVVYGNDTKEMKRAVQNIHTVTVTPYDSLNTYDVMSHTYLVFTKDALISMIDKYMKAYYEK